MVVADGGSVRVHGAALEHGDAAAVGRRGAGHRQPDRRLQDLSAGQGSGAVAPHRAAPAARGGFPARSATRPLAGAKTVLLCCSTRRFRCSLAGRLHDRSGSIPSAAPTRGNPHPARRRGDAHLRPAQRGLCLEFGDFYLLDAGDVVDSADRCGIVPAQPDQADPAPGRRRRKLRQGAARRRISAPAARGKRAAPRRPSSR